MSETITFTASVAKVATLADGGIRVTLDMPETAVMQAAQLMECKRAGVVLNVTVEALINKGETTDAVSEGQKRKPEWQATQEPRRSLAN